MITHKTEDGGGRFSVINLASSNVSVTVTTGGRNFFTDRPVEANPGSRSDPLDVPYGM